MKLNRQTRSLLKIVFFAASAFFRQKERFCLSTVEFGMFQISSPPPYRNRLLVQCRIQPEFVCMEFNQDVQREFPCRVSVFFFCEEQV